MVVTEAASNSVTESRDHPRVLGWVDVTALAMGGSNQSLFLIGALLAAQGSAAVPILVIGLLLSWAAAPGWTELSLMFPKRVGGISATCAEAFRPYAPVLSNLTGVCYWWGWVPTCGLTALLSASAIHQWFLPGLSTPLIAVGIVGIFTAVNLAGVRWVARLALPIAAVSATLAFMAALIPVLAGNVDWHRAADFHLQTPFAGWFGGVTSLMAGLYLVGFAAPAFEAAHCHVGEMRDPLRDLPRAVLASGFMAGVYFLVLPVIWLGVFGSGPLQGDLAATLGPAFAPLVGGAAKSAAIAFMVFNMFHGSLQPLAGASRTLAQLSEDGLLPRGLGKRSRTDAPWVATLATAAFATVFLLAGDPLWVVAGANLTYLIGIALPNVAVWLLRRNEPDLPRPWRAPRGTVLLGLFAAIAWLVATILGFEQFGLPTVLFGLGLAYSGAVAYAVRVWQDRRAAGLRTSLHSLHLKLTGAMLVVLSLDAAGYLLAVSSLSHDGNMVLVTVCEDVFVAVAILTIGVGLVLPGMVGHAINQVATVADSLATGPLAALTRDMVTLGEGHTVGPRDDHRFMPVVVRTNDELARMASSFNTMQEEIARASSALDAAAAQQLQTQEERARDWRLQNARFAVTRSLATVSSMAEAVPLILEGLCRSLEWCMAEYWEVGGDRIVRSGTWDDPGAHLTHFPSSGPPSRQYGEGIAGQVWAGREAIFLPDIRIAGSVRSRAAQQDGLRAVMAFPVLSDDEVFGVVTILSRRERVLDQAMLEVVKDVGSQIGQFLKRQRAEGQLRDSEIRSRAVLDNVTDGILTVNQAGVVESLNPAALELFGLTAAQAVGRPLEDILGPAATAALGGQVRQARAGRTDSIEAVSRRADGTTFPIELSASEIQMGDRGLSILSLRDISERRAHTEALEHQALHDALTGLPNRTLFIDRLRQSVAGASRDNQRLGILFMDLDGFKDVNDSLGHDVGDAFLLAIARRLRAALRDSDTVARLGGDEFAVLPDGARDLDSLTQVARQVTAALAEPFDLDGTRLEASASVGIAVYPEHGEDAAILMRHADVAMYTAKRRGSAHAVYAEGDDEEATARLMLNNELRGAIAAGNLTMHYQPKVDLRTGLVSSMEALVRWEHPTRGLVPPDLFIPMAEQSELIKPLTEFALSRAIMDLASLRAEGHRVGVAVNLSARNLHDRDIITTVVRLLAEHDVPAAALTVELTESTIMTGSGSRTLDDLESLGVRVSIDDFGTGYSSLAYLKRLPVGEIKIDRSFVTGLATNDDDAAIVRPTISLGHNLGLEVVAEGVEDEASYLRLVEYGCDYAQGYWISRPLAMPDLERWMQESPWAARRTGPRFLDRRPA